MNASHTYPRASSRGAGASLLAALLLGAAPAGANGRFPTARRRRGPRRRSDVIVLRTTFGLVMSRDAGATFHWMCEAQIYRPLFLTGEVDPSIAVAADGSVVYGFPQGIHLSPDGCRVARDPAAMGHHIADLTTDPSGERLFAIVRPRGGRPRPPRGRPEVLQETLILYLFIMQKAKHYKSALLL